MIKVLLVEDEPSHAILMQDWLNKATADEFSVETVTSLAAARAALGARHYDVVVADLGLPDSQGLDTIRGIAPLARTAPIVVLSATDDKQLALQTIAEGTQDYLVKGTFDPAVLERILIFSAERGRIKNALSENERKYRELLEEAADAIFITDEQLNFIEVNGQACALTGYSHDELLRMKPRDVIAPEYFPTMLAATATLRAGRPVRIELAVVPKDGPTVPVEAISTVLSGGRWMTNIRDISERKRAEHALGEANERVIQALESTTDSFYTLDRDWCFTFINKQAEKLLLRERGDLLGKNLWREFPEATDYAFYPLFHQAMASGEPVQFDILYPPLGGWFELRVFPNADGLAVYFRDINQARAAQEQLLARERAEASSQAKTEFLGRMSHELRTPLNAILGFAQLLKIDNLALDQDESVNYILEAGRHLLALINDILDISRIEEGQLNLDLEPLELEMSIQSAVEMLRPLATQHQLDLRVASPLPAPTVIADKRRLDQVLLNLISNAIKYNREGGSIAITWAEIAPGKVRLQVRDTGRGMSPEQLGRLFTPFDRLDAESLGIIGTGLGLTVSKQLVEAMGGSIGVESKIDEGSVFWVELPAYLVTPVAAHGPT